METEIVQQTPLRDTLTANFDAAEAGTLPTADEVARDEAGRFAKKEEKPEAVAPVVEQVQQPALQRPTTWKKDYLPIWDKIAAGDLKTLTPEELKKLAEYTNQRETEYKTGVSTYKAEATQANEVMQAMAPFMPELQAHGMKPADWIKQLGQANLVLAKGSPEQKLQMFQNLAQRYGVPLAAVQQAPGQVPQGVVQLLGIIDGLKNQVAALQGQVTGVTNFHQTVETKMLENEVQKFSGNPEKYPHFEAVREQMAQLLEADLAPDLETAYGQAIYLNPEVRSLLLTASAQPNKVQAAAQARSRAISPKSATPSGTVKAPGAKDRRSQLSEAFDAQDGGRV